MKLNPRNGIVRGSLLGLAVYGCVGVAGAADFYVSPTGNDSNDGLSPATAKRTLTGATGAIFAANSSAGADTINCAAGDYSAVPEPGTVAITEAVSILGPVGVRDLDPRSYIPSLASPNRTPAGAAEARFQTAATLATGVFNIAANNVTIKGLSIETTAVTQPIIHSAGARQNVVIEYNIIWRASASAPNATPLVGIFMSDSVNAAIRSNSFQNIAGADTAAPDAGVIWLTTPIDPTISSNEIRNTGAVDRSCGILLENSATGSDVVIDRNRVWANTGEGIGKYGISVGPGNTGNRIMISNNSVEDFEQAGISIQCPRVDVIGNYVGNINASTTGALARAGIYVRARPGHLQGLGEGRSPVRASTCATRPVRTSCCATTKSDRRPFPRAPAMPGFVTRPTWRPSAGRCR